MTPRRQGRPDAGRLCILTETYHPVRGGGETQARALAAGLAKLGWSVLVVTRRTSRRLPKQEAIHGATVRRVGPTGRSRVGKWALLLTAMWALVRHRRDYDVVLVSGFRILGIPAVVARRLLGKRVVLKADSLGEMSGAYFAPGLRRIGLTPQGFPFGLFLKLRNRLLRGADAFVAISGPVAEELVTAGIEPARVARVPNSVDASRFRPVTQEEKRALRRRLAIPADAFVVTYTGRLVSYKGLPLLLEAWRELTAQHEKILLLLVGSGGLDVHDCEETLRIFVRRHELSNAVRFAGEVDNVHEFLKASDAFVFPTENEAFGISLIEAMAVGLPVVSTDVGGVGDFLDPGRNGLRMEAGSRDDLRDSLACLVSDAELCETLSQEARRTVEQAFDESRVVRQYARLLATPMAGAATVQRESVRD